MKRVLKSVFEGGMKLWMKVLLGLILGVVVGLIFGENASYLSPLGEVFLSSIKMLIVPLIFTSLVVGVTSMNDPSKLGRIGVKTIILYLLTTSLAIVIGLFVGFVVEPGKGVSLESAGKVSVNKAPGILETLVNLIPQNPIDSLARGDVLQIITFALLLGLAINFTGKKAEPLRDLITSASEVVYKLTSMIMSLAPYGVFALMANVTGSYGAETLLSLLKTIVAVYLASFIHIFIVIGVLIFIFARLKPTRFFQGIINVQTVAFTTSSSSGTLPVTMQSAKEKLGVSENISSFVLPLGATINMDGTAIYQGVCALFIAQAYGIELFFQDYITIIFTATIASIGTGGVPGAGLIMLSLVLTSVNLPIEGVAIVAGIDRILDMIRTVVNVSGDSMVNLIIAKTENELDEKIYYS